MIDIEKVIELFKYHEYVKFIIPNCGEREYETVEFSSVIEILEKQLNNGWIPVSERLPEEEGYYLVYDENHQIIIEWRYTDRDTEWDNPYFATDHNVLAWMPLPEPWKE